MQALVEFINASTMNMILVTGLMASLLAVIFYELKLKARNIASLSIPLTVRMINRGGRVVDVRPADRFAAGHIVDAKNIPQQELLKNPEDLKRKNKDVILVCDTGASSGECVARLRKDGFENVYSLRGGLEDWRKENLPLVDAD